MSDPTPATPSSSSRSWPSALIAVLVGALGLGGGYLLRQPADATPIVIAPPPATATAAPATVAPTDTPAPLVVFVSGAVQSPGVYQLPPGARVADALAAAGGLSADANPNAVNQAAPLHDGDQVHIPAQGEAALEPPAGVRSAPVIIDLDAPGQLVNVNRASQAALEELPGIGPARARDIIANRPYATVDDLLRVPGIGPVTLESLRPLVTVE